MKPLNLKNRTSKWIGKIGNIVTLLNFLLKTVYFKQFVAKCAVRGQKTRIYEEHFYGDNYCFVRLVKKKKIMKLKPKRHGNANAL